MGVLIAKQNSLSSLSFFLSLRGKTVHSVHCNWIPQQAKIKCVTESATLPLFLVFFAVLDSTNKSLSHFTLKLLKKQASLRDTEQFVESTRNNKTCV